MWFGREGRHGVCMVVFSCCVFQTIAATPTHIELYTFYRQLNHDHANSFRNKKKEKKKDNKKAS